MNEILTYVLAGIQPSAPSFDSLVFAVLYSLIFDILKLVFMFTLPRLELRGGIYG